MNERIALVVPTRGDRPQLLEQCMLLISKQTRQPDVTCVVGPDAIPVTASKDVTHRYRVGFNLVRDLADVIVLWEDDDYYSPGYIETLMDGWRTAGRPRVFGYSGTCYYHLKTKKYGLFNHPGRASAMSTLVRTDALAGIKWPKDTEPFFDLSLWKSLVGVAVRPDGWTSIGIKHGIGVPGGIGHDTRWNGLNNADPEMSFLRSHVDADSFGFYEKLSKQL